MREYRNSNDDWRGVLGRRAMWTGLATVALLGAVLLGGALLPTTTAMAFGGFRHGPGHWRHSDPDERAAHAEMAVEWVLRWVDGSPEQREKITAIVTASMDELSSLRERHREQREALLAELSKPTIDRDAIETLRVEGLELVGEASGGLVAALTDAAEVLTAEQRRELIEVVQRFHDH